MALKQLWRKGTTRGRHGVIGVELGLEQFNLVQLREDSTNHKLAVTAYASSPTGCGVSELLQDEKRFTQALTRGLSQAKFVGRRAVAAMPSSLVRVMPLTYQLNPSQSDAEAIISLMQERIGDTLEDFVLDYMPVEKTGNDRQHLALVAMCRRESVVQYLELLRKSGLSVDALEIGPIAIQRLVAELQHSNRDNNILVVNCGQEKSYLTLVAGGRLLSDEEVSFGENTAAEQVSQVLELPVDLARATLREANLNAAQWQDDAASETNATLLEILRPALQPLVQEINRTLMFASSESHGAARNEVYLLGSFARWQGSDALLSEMLNVQVRKVPNPFVSFGSDVERPTPGMPELAVATGLALKDMQAKSEALPDENAQPNNVDAQA